ncbi:hypothetical protein DSO57_1005334 [Entomophthora muscae]|uniref:Uncharacterized protein n=1 Tax=Entomophthora muscae TaxID=34485 RepID=A0ACC2UTX2_9FUNG|nr:hypothetical protein DSO57_1005334 [Entomophthora muscae]
MLNFQSCVFLMALAQATGKLRMSGTIADFPGISLRATPASFRASPLDSYMSPVDLSILPPTRPPLKQCRVDIIKHTFANSYGKPSQSNYIPPNKCIGGGTISSAILNYQNQVKGTQFDRFGAIYIDRSEILRTTTAEPTSQGIAWEFEKDISQAIPLLYSPRTVTHILGNTVDSTYTGEFHVVASIDLYIDPSIPSSNHHILPISRDAKEPWYEINSSEPLLHSVQVNRQSLERAELEVFISGHGCDEFTYLNTPTEHARANKECEMGPFRELEVYLDDYFVGSVMPYPTIYTGGLSFVQWRPISGMGSFDLPTKVMDLAPYLSLLEEGTHTFKFHMKNATSLWFVTANLHLYVSQGQPKKMLASPIRRGQPDTLVVNEARDKFKTSVTSKLSTLSVQGFDEKVILTQVDHSVHFIHSIAYGRERKFHLTCTSETRSTTHRLNSNFNPATIDTLWDLPQPPIATQIRSETYQLTGTYILAQNLRQLNISLHSLTAANGITELILSGNSYIDNTDHQNPTRADNAIQGAIRHRPSTPRSGAPCYSRDLIAAHGDFTLQETGTRCPIPSMFT